MHDFEKFPELTNEEFQNYYFLSPHRQVVDDITVEVVKVIDGDTVEVQWYGRDFPFTVRFLNIAAPEKKDAGGIESKAWLENQVLGKTVDIKIDKGNRVGKWGRLLGMVQRHGMDVGEASVLAGHSVLWEEKNEGKIMTIDKILMEAEIG